MSNPKTRPRRKPVSEINVVPYIDVMLVLLVVFMITAPMLTQGVKIDLPNEDAPAIKLPKDHEMVIVSVKDDGSYYVNLGDAPKTAKTIEEIASIITKVKNAKPETPVLLEGDERVPYGVVVRLMVGLQRAGVNDVGLVTDVPEREI